MNNKDVKKIQKHMNKLQKALDELNEYVWAFEFLLPQGDGAKERAIEEWCEVCRDVVNKVQSVRDTQIDIIARN